MSSTTEQNKKKSPMLHLLAGGTAGLVEASVCHPLDTIKTRMQLRRQEASVDRVIVKIKHSLQEPAMRLQHSLKEPFLRSSAAVAEPPIHEPNVYIRPTTARLTEAVLKKGTTPGAYRGSVQASLGPFGTAHRIIQREGFLSLYKGLTAVYTGIVPKMAIRFVSFEQYRDFLAKFENNGERTGRVTFSAGLASGLTEAVLVVTPAEVCKIRLQSQFHSLVDPAQAHHRKYKNVVQAAYVIVREEGVGALYKGVIPTMLRQGMNQAVNFTCYNAAKKYVMDWQKTDELEHWQSLVIGGISGGLGPLCNNPLDVVKTRLQKQVVAPRDPPKYSGLFQACIVIGREEGLLALWKGITPRLLRIMPGQAITFMTYEAVSRHLTSIGLFK
mmetsp:Transcript_4184/g.8685  ORF Transcript_4184/g.8685 Transcript_4184/m.8685 type:complete len:385 (+) Transcript_4184:107-1261(+)|eukprot:CAMPEP_0168763080 /NCGR_PEP_ID=MMETSP0724-20121128/24175_1 /TAXON_ID=265536 /ORGANISM="Amphiprora sp., Strain CCMP467" /LENGTH=384 /DNA_ID=CAMNT_0008812265 /DNA_START=102 /DNA_END=1256 /DNA_ORIENTATION=-